LAHVLAGVSVAAEPTSAGDRVVEGIANCAREISFMSRKAYADPFNDVTVDAVVTAPDGSAQVVAAFWAGGRTWRIRYSAPRPGDYRFQSRCSDAANTDLQGAGGTIRVGKYEGNNPFYRHGPVRVAANRKHFEHVDGTPFLWLGDTWWMGLCKRLKWPEEFKSLTADRVDKGFNVVQIVAGLYPDMPAFDERGANEAGFPWQRDYARINPAYFDAADPRIAHLADSGLAPCIVGAWGYHLPWLGVERMKRHWRYLVARYGAYPVIWCLAGEGTMPYYLAPKKAEDAAFQKKGWTEVAAYLRSIDPYHHPISIHPSDLSRNSVEDPAVLDFEMLQTGHGDRASIQPTLALVKASLTAKPRMPTVNAEVCYEGILGTCPASLERFMVWSCLLSGTAGHTYGANGIWQVNRREQAFGASPHGGNWGTTPWDEAMALPGSRQTGLARKLLERFEWWRFEPHPEWAAPASPESLDRAISWGDWIWYPEGEPTVDAPAERRFFRRTFLLADGKQVKQAVIHISVDDRFTAYLNGVRIGAHHGWETPQRYDVKSLVKAGENVLAIAAENVAASVPKNPAGLLGCLHITHTDGKQLDIRSDALWRCARQEIKGWKSARFDDHGWAAAKVVAKYGQPPWGLLKAGTSLAVFASGIPGKVRVVYVTQAVPVRVTELEANARYGARLFDPVSGKETDLGEAVADSSGGWVTPTLPTGMEDWVLVLENK
jgi:hypothetical protein